jgi:DNA-binding PadR family transcriptional regulator
MRFISILSGDGFVLFNKELAHEVSVNGAIIFGQLCSSYESFGSKDMLTVRNGKEYFFLTSEVIDEETALSYRQQVKAIKDLEEAGYIEAVIMGSPARKYFHITDKIIQQLMPKENVSSDKREDLKESKEQESSELEQTTENFSYDKRAILACTKEQSKPEQKGNPFKKKKEKEQFKNIKSKFVNKESVNKNQEIIDNLVFEYMNKRLSKQVCLKVVDEVLATSTVHNLGGYLRVCLENALYKSKLKRGEIDFYEGYERSAVPFYDWLSDKRRKFND